MSRRPTSIIRLGLLAAALVAVGPSSDVRAYSPLAFVKTEGLTEQVGYLHWDQLAAGQSIPFSISTVGTPDIALSPGDPAIDEFEALSLAFQAWHDASQGYVDFDLTTTSTNAYGYDGENVIFFADLGPVGYGGVTLITYENTTGRILDVDVHMNDHDIEWWTSANSPNGEPLGCPCAGSDPAATYLNDVQGLATHEIGHVLGLDHSAVGTRESATTPTMYPRGIWGVAGDENLPPNSRYRSPELDDIAGLHALLPLDASHGVAALHGVVHDRFDRPLFGAHVVAKSLTTGAEIGSLTGLLEGSFDASAYAIGWLPADTYELRVEPLVGAPPGFVGPSNFGGISAGLLPGRFPEEPELNRTYHPFAQQPAQATPVELSPGDDTVADFRPLATLGPLPRFVRKPMAFPVSGRVNTELTGPLESAWLRVAIDGKTKTYPLSPNGNPFSIPMSVQPSGTLIEIGVHVRTVHNETYTNLLHRMQVGISSEPLLVASRVGGQTLAAVDSKTMFDFERTERVLSFPLAQVFHRDRFAIYGTEFGADAVSFVPLTRRDAEPGPPRPWDVDGDELLDELEPLFGTNKATADTDGDGGLDGLEVSRLLYQHPDAGATGFDVVGAAVPAGGHVPLGRTGYVAAFDVTNQVWATATLILPPSGRFELRLPAGPSYRLSLWTDADPVATNTPAFASQPGGIHVLGAIALEVPPPSQPMADPGSDPLVALDGLGLFRPDVRKIALPPGADPSALVLTPSQRFLFVTGFGTHELYKIDTVTNQIVATGPVEGLGPKGVAVSPDGARVYVANHGSSTVSIMNASDLTVQDVIDIHGQPQHIRVLANPGVAVVSVEGDLDLVLIDTATGDLVAGTSTGLGGMLYLDAQPRHGGLVLAGGFDYGSHELALWQLSTQEIRTIDLGPTIDVTAGVALHPNGRRGWAVHWTDPALLEFDVHTGDILRSVEFPFVDTRDLLVIQTSRPTALKPEHSPRPGRKATGTAR